MLFQLLLATVAIVAGGVAAVAGFGIGSLLTPTLAIVTGTKLAVAAISIPHFIGTAQRFWMLRQHVDRRVLWNFGITSAAGGLLGALVHTRASSRALSVVLGALLLIAGVTELSGWIEHVRWGRRTAWVAGAVSGALGGLVGNQGGIRTAAMLGFDVPKEAFVATATAIALFVDVARMPVYLVTQWRGIVEIWPLLLTASGGVVVGTMFGRRALARLPQRTFRRAIAVLLVVLGLYMVFGDAKRSHIGHVGSCGGAEYYPACGNIAAANSAPRRLLAVAHGTRRAELAVRECWPVTLIQILA